MVASGASDTAPLVSPNKRTGSNSNLVSNAVLESKTWEEKVKRSATEGLLFQLLAFCVAGVYFGPENWVDKQGDFEWIEIMPWALGLLACLCPWVIAMCSVSHRALVIGTSFLVSFWLIVGYLTTQHCLLHSRDRDLNPAVPVSHAIFKHGNHSGYTYADFLKNTKSSQTSAVICFSSSAGLRFVNKVAKAMHEEFFARWVHHAYPVWGVSFAEWWPYCQLLLGILVYRMYWLGALRKMPSGVLLFLEFVDCIMMFETFFDPNPYYWFEKNAINPLILLCIIAVFWLSIVVQIWHEFMSPSEYDKALEEKKAAASYGLIGDEEGKPEVKLASHLQPEDHWQIRFVLLNVLFLAIRFFLRVEAEYAAYTLMFKNIICLLMVCGGVKSQMERFVKEMTEIGSEDKEELRRYKQLFEESERKEKEILAAEKQDEEQMRKINKKEQKQADRTKEDIDKYITLIRNSNTRVLRTSQVTPGELETMMEKLNKGLYELSRDSKMPEHHAKKITQLQRDTDEPSMHACRELKKMNTEVEDNVKNLKSLETLVMETINHRNSNQFSNFSNPNKSNPNK